MLLSKEEIKKKIEADINAMDAPSKKDINDYISEQLGLSGDQFKLKISPFKKKIVAKLFFDEDYLRLEIAKNKGVDISFNKRF